MTDTDISKNHTVEAHEDEIVMVHTELLWWAIGIGAREAEF
jgi:hypothetical protein